MIHFKPTLGAKDTGRNVRSFVKEYHGELVDLLKSVGPYLLFFFIISVFVMKYYMQDVLSDMAEITEDVQANIDPNLPADERAQMVMQQHMQAQMEQNMFWGSPYAWLHTGLQLVIGYLFAVIAISWHRLVLLGKDHYEPMALFSPKKHEIEFLAMLALISFIVPFGGGYIIQKGIQEGLFPINIIYIGLPFFLILAYVYFKVCFYFPAKAVNSSITLKESFYLTKGYIWKMMAASFFATWCILLVMIAVFIVLGMGAGALAVVLAEEDPSSMMVVQSMLQLPIILYFQPLLTVIGVTVLSNYYQHAMQHKPAIEG